MGIEGGGTSGHVGESLWDGSGAVVCESEARVTACLSKLRRRTMWGSLEFLKVEERGTSVRRG